MKLNPVEPLSVIEVVSKALTMVGGFAGVDTANDVVIKNKMNAEHTNARAAREIILFVTAKTPCSRKSKTRKLIETNLEADHHDLPFFNGKPLSRAFIKGKGKKLCRVFSCDLPRLASENLVIIFECSNAENILESVL